MLEKASLQFHQMTAQFELRHHLVGQNAQRLALLRARGAACVRRPRTGVPILNPSDVRSGMPA